MESTTTTVSSASKPQQRSKQQQHRGGGSRKGKVHLPLQDESEDNMSYTDEDQTQRQQSIEDDFSGAAESSSDEIEPPPSVSLTKPNPPKAPRKSRSSAVTANVSAVKNAKRKLNFDSTDAEIAPKVAAVTSKRKRASKKTAISVNDDQQQLQGQQQSDSTWAFETLFNQFFSTDAEAMASSESIYTDLGKLQTFIGDFESTLSTVDETVQTCVFPRVKYERILPESLDIETLQEHIKSKPKLRSNKRFATALSSLIQSKNSFMRNPIENDIERTSRQLHLSTNKLRESLKDVKASFVDFKMMVERCQQTVNVAHSQLIAGQQELMNIVDED